MQNYNDLDLSFMAEILNKGLTNNQKKELYLIKQKNHVHGLLKTLKDADFELFITESNPNGTNDLLITKDGEVLDCLTELTFGLSAVHSDTEYQEVLHAYFNTISNKTQYIDQDEYLTFVKIFNPFTIAESIAFSPVNTDYSKVIKQLTDFISKHSN
jgi:hypothetical protein